MTRVDSFLLGGVRVKVHLHGAAADPQLVAVRRNRCAHLALPLQVGDLAAQADSGRWVFLPGLIIRGFGLGFVWTPVYSIATRNLSPELGGVASGIINTIQELGTVIASAAAPCFKTVSHQPFTTKRSHGRPSCRPRCVQDSSTASATRQRTDSRSAQGRLGAACNCRPEYPSR